MTPDDRDILAGELALGVLEGEARAEAQRLVLADPDFARAVERWRRHFATLHAEWPEVEPSPGLEARMLAPAAANDRGGRGWRTAAGLAGIVAAGLAVALVVRPERIVERPAPPVLVAPPPLVAALAPAKAGKPFGAVYDAARGEIRLALDVPIPAGRDAELWTIGADAVPHSLGVVARSGAALVVVAGPNRARVAAGTTLAITAEPLGGAPQGKPTGPVVAAGVLGRV